MTRVYYPATLDHLATYVEAGELRSVEGVACGSDDEPAEYAALMQAAEESQRLLGGSGRRVVVVADLADADDPDAGVPFRLVVAVHADSADRPVDADPDEDLGWYATQEIADLLASR